MGKIRRSIVTSSASSVTRRKRVSHAIHSRIAKVKQAAPVPEIKDLSQKTYQRVFEDWFKVSGLPPSARANFVVTETGISGADWDLDLSRYKRLKSLPEGLLVGGNLNLFGCKKLKLLPKGLVVDGVVDLSRCTSLTSLPEGLKVGGKLDCSGCTGLRSIPADLEVAGYLEFYNCTGLRSLPEGLTLNSALRLTNCTGLTQLPARLHVGDSLDLSGCTGLTSIPEGLRVGGHLSLQGCTGLTSLPSNFFSIFTEGRHHTVNLTGVPISQEVLTNLRSQCPSNVTINHSVHESRRSSVRFASLPDSVQFWNKQLTQPKNPVPSFLNIQENAALLEYLSRLIGTADFKNTTTRSILAIRIFNWLELMNSDPEFQEECLTLHIPGSMDTCGDRVNLAFNDMEIKAAIKVVGDKPDDIKRLAKGLLYIEELTKIAQKKIATLRFTDPIEVQLMYQVKLAEQLQLPIQTKAMLYEGCAGISNEDLAEALLQVTQNVTEERLEEFLKTFTPWQKIQQNSYEAIPKLQAGEDVGDTKVLQCTISQYLHDELEKPVYVLVKQGDRVTPTKVDVFEFDLFLQWWREHFSNPNTRETVLISQLRRPG